MEIRRITDWLDGVLDVAAFADVSNNGVQISGGGRDVGKVAFAVDASLASVRAAAQAGAGLLVVHHGISWGGGMARIVGATYEIVKTAIDAGLALYAVHLPLDANEAYGNNFELARHFGLEGIEPAFSWRGSRIGCTGFLADGRKVGICSGGGGEFAVEAKELGCDLFVTGEASWGEVIAAENAGMKMVCAGHYETETFGVRALARAMRAELGVETVFLPRSPGEDFNLSLPNL